MDSLFQLESDIRRVRKLLKQQDQYDTQLEAATNLISLIEDWATGCTGALNQELGATCGECQGCQIAREIATFSQFWTNND